MDGTTLECEIIRSTEIHGVLSGDFVDSSSLLAWEVGSVQGQRRAVERVDSIWNWVGHDHVSIADSCESKRYDGCFGKHIE